MELNEILDYCQNDLEFDNCREYIIEHGAEGLTREEIFANKPGMKKLFEEAGLD